MDSVCGRKGLDSKSQAKVDTDNLVTVCAARVCRQAAEHDAVIIAETSACRRAGFPDATPGCESHVYMFDHPDWVKLFRDFGGGYAHFHQCMVAEVEPWETARKATTLYSTARAHLRVQQHYADKTCTHTYLAHRRLVGVDADTGRYATSGSEEYSTGTCKSFAECIILILSDSRAADAEILTIACVGGVIHGKRLARAAVTGKFIHRSFNHAEKRVLSHLPKALSDAEAWWVEMLVDEPCDACLRGDAPLVGPTGHHLLQEGVYFMDIYHYTIPALFTGERCVLGMTHAKTKFSKSVRIHAKSEAHLAVELCHCYFNSCGKPIRHIHTDNAGELCGSKVAQMAKARGWRITTIVVGAHNQNPQEPQWPAQHSVVRKDICQAKMPYELWGVSWDHVEEGRMLLPSRSPPHECKLGKFLDIKPPGAFRRPFGCLCYPTVVERYPNGTLRNKMAPQAPRAIHCGYKGGRSGSFEQLGDGSCQPGYICYLPDKKSFVIADSVRFVPDCFPGLKRSSGGGWEINTANIPFHEDAAVPAENKDSSLKDVNPETSPDEAADDTSFELHRGFPKDMPIRGGDVAPTDSPADDVPADADTDPVANNVPAPEFAKSLGPCTPDAPIEVATTPPVSPLERAADPKRKLVHRALYPDEDCDEHGGRGWEVELLKYSKKGKGKYLCRWVNSMMEDGSPWENQWIPRNVLMPLPALFDPPPAQEIGSDDDCLVEPSPNEFTVPHQPGADPLREPSRPVRAHNPIDRFSYLANVGLSSMTSDLSNAGFDPTSKRLPVDALHINPDVTHGSIGALASSAFISASFNQPVDIGLTAEAAGYACYTEHCYHSLSDELQRVVSAAVDHSSVVAEFGTSAPETQFTRQVYAAAAVDAALIGERAPKLDPLYSCVASSTGADPELRPLADIFDPILDGALLSAEFGDVMPDLSFVSKGQSSPNIFSERQMTGQQWDEPKQIQIGKLLKLDAMTKIAADDKRIKGIAVVPTMWVGRRKVFADGTDELSGRCVCRGDIHSKTYDVSANQAYSPVTRNSSSNSIDAVACLRDQNCEQYDLTAAYLQGKQLECERTLNRAPPGFRDVDERGVELLWWMNAPLYGQTDAGAILYRTFCEKMSGEPHALPRCANEPCVFSAGFGKHGRDRVTNCLYVDDGRICSDPSPAGVDAHAKVKAKLNEFQIKFGTVNQTDDMFLGSNRKVASPGTCKVYAETYIDLQIKRYAKGDISGYPASWSHTPADETLVNAFEAASLARARAPLELEKRYMSLFGALLHASKFRPEICACLGMLGTCLTFSTEELYDCMMRVLVYLGRTKTLGITYSKHGIGANKLKVFADSNWAITRSISGFTFILAGGSISHASRRQHCISMSSCEAELIALADAAIELLHVRALLEFIGHEFDGPVEVATDNKAAYDLCHRFTSAQNSRHIDRKLFKMRELRGAGLVTVSHVPTELNPADLFTKILSRQPFEKHRKTVLNLPGDTCTDYARRMKQLAAKD